MKAHLEKIDLETGSSFRLLRFEQSQEGSEPFWHFHPEYEIVYISHGRGKRHIANHISYYEDGDLIFLGPKLPHSSFSEELSESHTEVVVQMRSDFMGEGFFALPETRGIQQLFERSRRGISFFGATKRQVGDLLLGMLEEEGFRRLLGLLQILQVLAESEEYVSLEAESLELPVDTQHYERIQRIYAYVHKEFQGTISLEAAASEANMSVPAFCRFFKKASGKTFTQFVSEVRVAHACNLLSTDTMSIAAISFECGFNNLSHFNKQFRMWSGFTPREYRMRFKKVVDMHGVDG